MDRANVKERGRLERLRRELAEQAQLFEDPGAYLAGIEDVFSAIAPRPEDELPPRGGWFG